MIIEMLKEMNDFTSVEKPEKTILLPSYTYASPIQNKRAIEKTHQANPLQSMARTINLRRFRIAILLSVFLYIPEYYHGINIENNLRLAHNHISA